MAFDGKAIYEGDTASGGMTGIRPVPGFKQNRLQQSNFDDLSADAVNLDPITHADAISSHKKEPSEEGHDHIFAGNGKSGTGKAEYFRCLAGHAEDDEQNH